MLRTPIAALILLGTIVTPAAAAEPALPALSTAAAATASVAAPATASVAAPAIATSAVGRAAASPVDAAPMAANTDWSLGAVHIGSSKIERGAILPTMYLSLAALNAYDVYSTRSALSQGAAEANGAMRTVAGSSAAMVATKAAVTAGTIVVAEHLWKTHRKGQAIAMMVITNGLMSAVAVHNNAVLHGISR